MNNFSYCRRAWVKGALVTSDLELLQSCGLDALMMVKVSALGVQLCLPLCICGLCICEWERVAIACFGLFHGQEL